MKKNYDALKLESQLCFPLYAASREIIKKYTPLLNELDLTYTQYVAMMVMWEEKEINVKDLGEKLYLDSGTLTPLLKKLEAKGYINRERSKEDERSLIISITEKGDELRDNAIRIPQKVSACVNLDPKKAKALYSMLYELLDKMEE